MGLNMLAILLILQILHDLRTLSYHNSQALGHLGSCRMLRVHRRSYCLDCLEIQNVGRDLLKGGGAGLVVF